MYSRHHDALNEMKIWWIQEEKGQVCLVCTTVEISLVVILGYLYMLGVTIILLINSMKVLKFAQWTRNPLGNIFGRHTSGSAFFHQGVVSSFNLHRRSWIIRFHIDLSLIWTFWTFFLHNLDKRIDNKYLEKTSQRDEERKGVKRD